MEILGVQALQNADKPTSKATPKGGDGAFLAAFEQKFSTVKIDQVDKSYMTDGSLARKETENRPKVEKIVEDEDEDSMVSLYSQYKRILKKLYQLKNKLS